MGFQLNKRLEGLPVYHWDDDHDENEWIAIDHYDAVWYVCGFERTKIENLKAEDLKTKNGLFEEGVYYESA